MWSESTSLTSCMTLRSWTSFGSCEMRYETHIKVIDKDSLLVLISCHDEAHASPVVSYV